MAEQVAKDVVKEAQSVGRSAPIDDSASTTNTPAVNGDPPSGTTTTKSTPPEAPSTKPIANGTDTVSTGSAHVSEKAEGNAGAADNKPSGVLQQETRQPHLNGTVSEHLAADSLAVADVSGGSDTDISRPGSVDQSKRDGTHVRTSSTAKKQPFKSVSVTKSFLAKTVPSAPAARSGDKAAPAAPLKTSNVLSAKPRLVAKSGASNTPRALGQANGAGAGPDASKVWNKNQPVPPPPPKQFTDEELKQQYGIHLATRLQADEAGKEAKWADIDDDEDDWAPDTVQWMDGTKSSVAVPPETQPPPVEEPKTILKPESSVEAPKPSTSPSPAANAPKTSVTGSNKTILKPGAHAQPASGKSSLVLKGQPEKPTLVAKPSATEKKSPWAPLPPIEKVSPIQVNPPAHPPPPQRYSQRDPYGYDSMPPPSAKEIAPDDFNRSWRNDGGGRDTRDGRELFNSQSGRYEPVHNDVRRGSGRDSGFRQQPSLLQRPSQDGPAEPSAAFQTSRASADGPTWGRRRNSSNVSGGMPRRMSIDPRAPDMPAGPMHMERRESHSVNGYDPAESVASRHSPFQQMKSPNVTHAHPVSPYGSVTSPAVQDAPAAAAAAAVPTENPVEVQKRLMAEKIERARLKKQQDQEAERRAEAERKERIAKKLAAMGPPESKSKTKDLSPSRPEKSPLKDKVSLASVQSPPKPPVPTADGEVTQYGMMKVHQPHPVKKSPQTEHAHVPGPSQQMLAAPGSSATAPPSLEQQSAQSFDTFTHDSEARSSVHSEVIAHQSDGAVHSGPRPQGPPAAWSPATVPQPRPWTSQVWGPPQPKDRALGNGTFDSGYRGQSRPGAPQQLPVQPPVTAPIVTGIAPQSLAPQSTRQVPPSQPMFQQRSSQGQPPTSSRQGRIAKPVSGGGWDTFSELISKDDKASDEKNKLERERQGEAFRPELRETYKDQRGQAQVTLHDKIAAEMPLAQGMKKDDVPKSANEGSSPQQGLGQGTLQQATGSRASRFFPRPPEPSTPLTALASSKADSPPPPPETETHPAFGSDSGHPLVRLPKPSPVVRLPPLASGSGSSAAAQVNMPSRGQALGARPLAMNPEWQARFNKLLDKPGSSRPASHQATSPVLPVVSPQQGAVAPAASSKISLDVRGSTGPATVSLPAASQRFFANDCGRDVITRKGAEALFEDREFGSLPTVKLSKIPHLAANQSAKAAPKDEQHPKYKKFENPFTIRRLEAFDIEKTAQNKGKFEVVVRIANMREPVTKSVPRKHYGPKLNRQLKPKPSASPNAAFPNGAKDRLRKPSQQGQADRPYNSNNTLRPSGAKPWSSNNNNNNNTRASPAHQPTTWAKLAAA